DEDVLAGGEGKSGRLEMAVVGRGDTDDVDAMLQESRDGVRAGEGGEVAEEWSVRLAKPVGPAAGPAGDGRQADLDRAEVTPVKRLTAELLEDGPVGVVEDHSQADHAGPD